jgi:hypothetical protein
MCWHHHVSLAKHFFGKWKHRLVRNKRSDQPFYILEDYIIQDIDLYDR